MMHFTTEDYCGTKCPEVTSFPSPVDGSFGMCETHMQWWHALPVRGRDSLEYVWEKCLYNEVPEELRARFDSW